MLKNILKKVRKLEINSKNKINSIFSGNYRSAFKGRGIEFADIRIYDFGDDVRDIDWKTTSKQGELYVKTYHESRDNTLFFVIDGSPNMFFSSIEKFKYEKLLETFALLAFAAVQNGDRVGILFYGNGKEKIFPPKKGQRNVLQILKFCIEQYQKNPKKTYAKVDLSKIFRKILSFLNHSSVIFWLNGELETLSPIIRRNIKMLHFKHDFTPIVFSDPMENSFSEEGEFSFKDSFTDKITSITVDSKLIKNYKKIRYEKSKKFKNFFYKNNMETLLFDSNTKIFQQLFLFFRKRQI